MLCLRVTRRGPGTASRRSAGCRHHLYALPAPGTVQPMSRPNVKTQATTKLTAIEFEGWSRTFSPPDASGSRKSSPARQDHRYRHAVRAAALVWMPGGQNSRMKNLWFSHVAQCIPEQNRADHRGCRDIKPTSVATSVRTRQRSREVIHADLFTASNASTPFVIRTTRRQFMPTQVAAGITVQRLVAGPSAARCSDAIVLALIAVTPNRGRLWEKPLLELRRPAT